MIYWRFVYPPITARQFQLWQGGSFPWLLIGGSSGYLIRVLLVRVALRCHADDAVSACLYSHSDPSVFLPDFWPALSRMDFFLPAPPAGTHTHASSAVSNCAVVVYFYLRGIPFRKVR